MANFFQKALRTAKEIYEADRDGNLHEYVDGKFTQIANSLDGSDEEQYEERISNLFDMVSQFMEDEKYDAAIETCDDILADSSSLTYSQSCNACYFKARALRLKAYEEYTDAEDETQTNAFAETLDAAMSCIEKAIEDASVYVDENSSDYEWAVLEKAHIHRGHFSKRKLYIQCMDSCDSDIRSIATDCYKEETDIIFNYLFEDYKNTNLEEFDEEDREEVREMVESNKFQNFIEYPQRQFIFIVPNMNKIAGCYDDTDNINWVFTADRIPSDIRFPVGHPQPNTLYYCHPVKQDYYMPFDGAEKKLFHEKVHEFCYLMQCLGATEIVFHTIKGEKVTETSARELSANIDGGVKVYEGSAEYSGRTSSSLASDSIHTMDVAQRFNPIDKPFCPEGLTWFAADEEWNTVVKQRLNGNLLSYNMRISSENTCQLSGNQKHAIKAAFSNLMAKVNSSFNYDDSFSYAKSEETEWEIHVKFKSIDEFNNSSTAIVDNNNVLTEQEQEYYDELKDCLAEDGTITDRERKLLDRIRRMNGISEVRACEIEQMLKPKLSAEEQEYLDEYKEIIAEGNISDRDRRYLDKIMKMNGITESRARELEDLA